MFSIFFVKRLFVIAFGRHLDLSACGITSTHLRTLMHQVPKRLMGLSTLSLARNTIADPATLVQLIDLAGPSLLEIDVSGNPLVGPDGTAVTDGLLKERSPGRLREALSGKTHGTVLFSDNPSAIRTPVHIDPVQVEDSQLFLIDATQIKADLDPEKKIRDGILRTIGRHGESGVSESGIAAFMTDVEGTPIDRKAVGRHCDALSAKELIFHNGIKNKNSRWRLVRYRADTGPASSR